MNDTLVKDEAATSFHRPMILADRCDQCPNHCSQAFVRAVKTFVGYDGVEKEHELLFCGHHYREHEPSLVMDGWLIQDERDSINEKPMSGAPEGALSVNEE
jgi:hypothetical protein